MLPCSFGSRLRKQADKYEIVSEKKEEIKGLSHYLSSDYPIEEAIFHTQWENGDILPNIDNVINPSMLLESNRFEEMLAYMEEKYRYVFIDSPPLSPGCAWGCDIKAFGEEFDSPVREGGLPAVRNCPKPCGRGKIRLLFQTLWK